MEDIYKGNSIPITINANYKDGSQYIFKAGDVLIIGIKRFIKDTQYVYKYETLIVEPTATINLNISPEFTEDIEDEHIIEGKLICNNGNDVFTIFQEKFDVKGVVIDD